MHRSAQAGLRTGVVAEPWAQEALAMSLEACQGSTEEIERAKLSGIDLEPKTRSPISRRRSLTSWAIRMSDSLLQRSRSD